MLVTFARGLQDQMRLYILSLAAMICFIPIAVNSLLSASMAIQDHEEQLQAIQRKLEKVKERLDSVACSGLDTATDPTLVEKVLQLEKKNAEVSTRITSLSTTQANLLTDEISE